MAGSQDMMSYEVGSGSSIPEDLKGNMMSESESAGDPSACPMVNE